MQKKVLRNSLQASFAKPSLDSHLSWRAPDEKIHEDINAGLARHPETAESEINVRVKDGRATLSGTIASRHLKELTEEFVLEVSGVAEVINELRIDTTLVSESRTISEQGESNA